jgi:hypothetical protein
MQSSREDHCMRTIKTFYPDMQKQPQLKIFRESAAAQTGPQAEGQPVQGTLALTRAALLVRLAAAVSCM